MPSVIYCPQLSPGQYSIIKGISNSAAKYMNIHTKTINSLTSVQVRFCLQMSSNIFTFAESASFSV